MSQYFWQYSVWLVSWIVIEFNLTVSVKCLDMTFAVIWRCINKIEFNLIYLGGFLCLEYETQANWTSSFGDCYWHHAVLREKLLCQDYWLLLMICFLANHQMDMLKRLKTWFSLKTIFQPITILNRSSPFDNCGLLSLKSGYSVQIVDWSFFILVFCCRRSTLCVLCQVVE